MKKQLFGAWKVVFFDLQFRRVSLCSGALGSWKRHLKSLVPAPKSVWKGKWKNNFSGPEKLFFKFAIWKGLPLQWRSVKSLVPAPKSVWKGKWKNNFSEPEKLFFNLHFGRVSLCSGALGGWKRHLKSLVPAPKSVWKGKWKNNFSGPEKLFFSICNFEGFPFAVALWAAGKGTWKA